MSTHIIHFDHASEAREIGALLEPLIPDLEAGAGPRLLIRDMTVSIAGSDEAAAQAARFIEALRLARTHVSFDSFSTRYAFNAFMQGHEHVFETLAGLRISVSPRKPSIYPKTIGQRVYLDTIAKHAITFGIGPAGTGKTYLAMAMAVSALLKEEISRIILARPAIEAGENLGFLPGDFQQKVAPYLRPLYDALYDMLPSETIDTYLERGVIEVAPLAYMRGRTLNHAFVILDEAQNSTPQQMLMFLTRLGFDSKCVITGDLTQVDLPPRTLSGLLEARGILNDIDGIAFVEFSERDVVRHPLVQKVIEAYQQKRAT